MSADFTSIMAVVVVVFAIIAFLWVINNEHK